MHAACGACKDGPLLDDCETVALLVGLGGADPNSKDSQGETPLMWASYYGRKEVRHRC